MTPESGSLGGDPSTFDFTGVYGSIGDARFRGEGVHGGRELVTVTNQMISIYSVSFCPVLR